MKSRIPKFSLLGAVSNKKNERDDENSSLRWQNFGIANVASSEIEEADGYNNEDNQQVKSTPLAQNLNTTTIHCSLDEVLLSKVAIEPKEEQNSIREQMVAIMRQENKIKQEKRIRKLKEEEQAKTKENIGVFSYLNRR